MVEYSNTPVAKLPVAYRPRIQRRYSGTALENDVAERTRVRTARSALQDIADAQGDVDAFVDQVDEDTRKKPAVAAGIARRLLAAGRAGEALKAVDVAEHDEDGYLTRTDSRGRPPGSMRWKGLGDPMRPRLSDGAVSRVPCRRPISARI